MVLEFPCKIGAWLCGRQRGKGFGIHGKLAEKDQDTEKLMMHRDDYRFDSSIDISDCVKQEDVCSNVFRLLIEKEVKIVGICGARGVGKSSILRKLELEALDSKKFRQVFRITAPDTGCIEEKIISDLAMYKGLRFFERHERLKYIIDFMQNESFLILIDDLVKPIPFIHDLLNPPHKHKKFFGRLVFTTRLRNLPRDISCPSLHIAPLSPKQSWRLVHEELLDTHVISDSATMKLAEELIEDCNGLPLALKVLAGAIKGVGRRPLEEFRRIANELSSPIKLYRFAMDCLPSNAVRECFIYAAMFPKDHWILEEELIQLWIGEELLPINAGSCHVTDQIQLGQDVIEILKSANLLVGRVSERKWEGKVVQMHNTLRHIALCDNREFFVQSGAGLEKAPAAKKWALAKRISFMYNEIKELTETPRCNWLETMLLRYNRDHLAAFPQNFFKFSPRLRVLDLSFSHVRELPPSIGMLAELQYLDLSHTELERLPEEMRKLKKLKWLCLRRTYRLDVIPRRLLSSLVALQSLNAFMSGFRLDKKNSSGMIQDMENMKDLGLLGITTNDVKSLQKICRSKILGTKIECVEFSSCREVVDIQLSPILGSMEGLKQLLLYCLLHLESISIGYDSSRLVQCFRNLERLEIIYCPLLENISWAQCLPNLFYLVIQDNNRMKKLFNDRVDGYEQCFPKLKYITLSHLNGLRDIGDSVVFPCLHTLVIDECPNLRNFPKGLVGSTLKEIHGWRQWWDNLCMDEITRSSLSPLFIPSVSMNDQHWETINT